MSQAARTIAHDRRLSSSGTAPALRGGAALLAVIPLTLALAHCNQGAARTDESPVQAAGSTAPAAGGIGGSTAGNTSPPPASGGAAIGAGNTSPPPSTAGIGGTTTTPAGTGGMAGTTPSAGSDGATPDAGATSDAGTDPSVPETGTFPAVTDLQADGPFADRTIDNTGPNDNYTVFLPQELGKDGRKHPLVGWMSGGSTNPSLYTLLPHLASHGFVIVASNTIPAIGEEVALGAEIIAGIDWALAENERSGSELYGKLDATKVASMGYSMGGLATFTIADDPRLTTTVHISGGNMETERVQKLHAPAAFICGESDIAGPNCATDFDAADTPVFYGTFMGGDHLGVLTPPYADRIRGAVTGWLRFQLMADQTQRKMFIGADCSLCKDASWTVKQKNLM